MTKKTCCRCGQSNIICWGKQMGKQRYKCKDFGLLFQWGNTALSYTVGG